MSNVSLGALNQLTSTAIASYGSFLGRSDEQSKIALTVVGSNANFASTQADTFVVQYSLLDQLPNVPDNGFSASIFLDKTTNKHVLAIRGSDQLVDDLVLSDLASIGGNGFANTQAVEMIRYYKRLITPGGQAVQYTDQEKWQLFAIGNSLLVPLTPTTPPLRPALAASFATF